MISDFNDPELNGKYLGTITSDFVKISDVLKDASSTAIYGARGANGVVLITTKGGTEGRSNALTGGPTQTLTSFISPIYPFKTNSEA